MTAEVSRPLSVDPAEIERFTRMAAEWWDEHGKFRPLHVMNPVRIEYIRDVLCRHFGRDAGGLQPLAGLSLVDIGCGGGLISEPMARLGASVTGVDAGEKNIAVAQLHAEKSALEIDYRHGTAEELAAENAPFDVVLALEIIEHVADVSAFMQAIAALVKPGGVVIMSTLNRTPKAYLLAILGAEYVLRWLPRGTHEWKKFLRPSELAAEFRATGLRLQEQTGLVFNPLNGTWRLHTHDLSVNYISVAVKI